ncbi:MAG: phage holin family protein [Capsulimonas sp.]|uniref:phage holin family protein n=1 Tax=Capsulimonas sp. TaxID=2494211 RepID=UPI0032665CD0
MQFLYRWAISAIALYLTVLLVQLLIHHGIWIAPGTKGVIAAVIAAAALGIVNAVIRPVVQLLTLPLTCLTFGLFSFVINALMFWLVGNFVDGFHVKGFIAPLLGSIIMGLISGILNNFLISDREKQRR